MSLLCRLFGAKKDESPAISASLEYEDFRITPEPMKEAQGYRLCAIIEKEIEGEVKTHRLIRADTISNLDACNEASISKAKQMIDQLGLRLFG